VDFFEYLAKEDQNLLVSLHTHRRELNLFDELDCLYQELIDAIQATNNITAEEWLAALLMRVHHQLYSSTASFFKCHLSESFASTRIAIDATLSAYKIFLDPNTAQDFVDTNKKFKFIKSHIEKERKRDSSRYPLAPQLIEFHEVCSEYGAHCDSSSFIHKLDPRVENLVYNCFQNLTEEDFKKYFKTILFCFLYMFKIFSQGFSIQLKIDKSKWLSQIDNLEAKLHL